MKFKGIKGRWILYFIILSVLGFIFQNTISSVFSRCYTGVTEIIIPRIKSASLYDIFEYCLFWLFSSWLLVALGFANSDNNINIEILLIIICPLNIPIVFLIRGVSYCIDNDINPLKFFDKHFSTGEYKTK